MIIESSKEAHRGFEIYRDTNGWHIRGQQVSYSSAAVCKRVIDTYLYRQLIDEPERLPVKIEKGETIGREETMDHGRCEAEGIEYSGSAGSSGSTKHPG